MDDHYKETLFNEDRWLLLFGGKTTSDDNAFFTLSAPTTQSTVSKQQASHRLKPTRHSKAKSLFTIPGVCSVTDTVVVHLAYSCGY